MGRLHAPVLRPARAQRGLRPAARRRGITARGLIATGLLAVALWSLIPAAASADTLTPQGYRQRLVDARALLSRARPANAVERAAAVDAAKALLKRTDAIALVSGTTIAIDDRGLADRIVPTPESIAAAIELLDAQIGVADRAERPIVDPALADQRLREVLRDTETRAGSATVIELIVRAVSAFLAGLQGPRVDFGFVWPVLGALGVTVILFILATLGRSLPERVRTEIAVREPAAADRPDPAAHLRAADAALAEGRARDAIHALYLFALTSLAAREAIRYDPALTDRELMVRAAGIPHAQSLRDLVALYERSWFGLREPDADEARSARSLATRVAG